MSDSVASVIDYYQNSLNLPPSEIVLGFSALRNNTELQSQLIALIDRVEELDVIPSDDPSKKTKTVGDALENVGHFLLETSNLFSRIDSNTKGKVHELDYSCTLNDFCFGHLTQGYFDNNKRVLGEAKNYKNKKIDVNIVYKVGSLASFQKFPLSIIFARRHFTGDELTAAYQLTTKFKAHNGVTILIFTNADYELIKKHPSAFNLILYYKLCRWFDHTDHEIDYNAIETELDALKERGFFEPQDVASLLS